MPQHDRRARVWDALLAAWQSGPEWLIGVTALLVALLVGTLGYLVAAPTALDDQDADAAVVVGGRDYPSAAASIPASPSPSPSPSESTEPSPTDEPVHAEDLVTGTGSDAVALTFDDGPHPKWTPKFLDLLREHDVTATFCVVGAYAEQHPDLVATIADDGHTLCNHSWFHELDLGTERPSVIRDNITRTNDAITAAAGVEVTYYRQPGGEWTQPILDVLEDLDMRPLHWSVDPRDWDAEVAAKDIKRDVKHDTDAGDIVLFHDGASRQKYTYRALKTLLPYLNDKFELVPL